MKRYAILTMKILTVIAAILLIVLGFWNYSLGQKYETYVAEIRSEQCPVTLADLEVVAPPANDNGAVWLERVRDDASAIDTELNYLLADINQGHLDAGQAAKIAEAFTAHPQFMETLGQVASASEFVPLIDYSRPPEELAAGGITTATWARSVARCLQLHQAWQEHEGHFDLAVDDAVLLLRLSRRFDQHPFVTNYLISLACRGIAVNGTNRVIRQGSVSPECRKRLDEELTQHDSMSGLRPALVSERAFGISSFRSLGISWYPIYGRSSQIGYLELMKRHIKAADLPFHQLEEKSLVALPSSGVFSMLISPALVACRDSTERLRAMMRCLRVLNALPAATGTDSGFPWDQLNLPAEACIDPFTGQRLRTKRTPQGWIIYSVSANKIDDDGEIRNGGDFGLGPVGSDDAV